MTDKIKLAAIKLKGVGSADRKWILSQLSVQERNKLDPVLAQLDQITFDQVFHLDELVDFDGNREEKIQEVAVTPLKLQEQPSTQLVLDPNVTSNLRKVVARHSDIFLSIFVSDSFAEDDPFLSQLVDRSRHLRIISLAKKRKKVIPTCVVNRVRATLIKSAENGI